MSTTAWIRNAVCVEENELELRVPIGQPAGPGAEDQCRPDLGDEHPRRPPRVAGAVVQQPHERCRLHPRADERNDLAEKVAAVVAMPKRAKGGFLECREQPRVWRAAAQT